MNKTNVYVADTELLKEETLFGELYQTVSPDRQRKVDKFLFEKDKRLSLAAELVLKKALLNVGIDKFEIIYGRNGKPYIKNEDIYFNLSHSEERVFCAISSKEVGCDVERIMDIDLAVAKQFFCATEYEKICAMQSKEEQKNMFYRIWTLKESFMKATGLGAALPLDSFCINEEGDNVYVNHTVNSANYYFKEYNCGDGYQYAVCSGFNNFDTIKIISLM